MGFYLQPRAARDRELQLPVAVTIAAAAHAAAATRALPQAASEAAVAAAAAAVAAVAAADADDATVATDAAGLPEGSRGLLHDRERLLRRRPHLHRERVQCRCHGA